MKRTLEEIDDSAALKKRITVPSHRSSDLIIWSESHPEWENLKQIRADFNDSPPCIPHSRSGRMNLAGTYFEFYPSFTVDEICFQLHCLPWVVIDEEEERQVYYQRYRAMKCMI